MHNGRMPGAGRRQRGGVHWHPAVLVSLVVMASACASTPPAVVVPSPTSPAVAAPPAAIPTAAPDPIPNPAPAAAATATSVSVDPLTRLRLDLTQATQQTGVSRGAWGVVVQSLDRDERLFELNPRMLLVPASVAKLAAVATAAEAVGWDYRFETTLRTTGPIVDGVLQGDLIVVGSGDPTIGGRAGEDIGGWVDALKSAGIRRIDGRIIGEDDAIEEPRPQLAWAWDDLGYATGSLFGALNFAENRLAVTVTPGAAAGTPAAVSVEPHAAYRPLSNRVITAATGASQLVWPEQRPGE